MVLYRPVELARRFIQLASNDRLRVADHPPKDRNPDYLLKLAAKLSRDMGLP